MHDAKLLEPTLKHVAVKRPTRGKASRQHLCGDKAYDGEPSEKVMRRFGYIPHIRRRGEEIRAKARNPRYRARRWVVEGAHSWLNRYRKLTIRYEKFAESYEGLLELACALIAFKQTIVICG